MMEWIVYSFKLLIIEYFFLRILSNSTVFGVVTFKNEVKAAITILNILDLALLNCLVQYKLVKTRQIVSLDGEDYWQNGGSIFENIYFFLDSCLMLMDCLQFFWQGSSTLAGLQVIQIVKLLIRIAILVYYLYEQPYLNLETSLLFGGCQVVQIVLSTEVTLLGPLGVRYNAASIFLVPLSLILLYRHSRRFKMQDSPQKKNWISKSHVKLILSPNRSFLSPDNISEVIGSLYLHYESCTDTNCRCRRLEALFRDFMTKKLEDSAISGLQNNLQNPMNLKSSQHSVKGSPTNTRRSKLHSNIYQATLIDTDSDFDSLLENRSSNLSDHLHSQFQETVYLIEDFVLHQYIKQSNSSLQSLMYKLIWQLRTRIVISEILSLLDQINKSSITFQNRQQVTILNLTVTSHLKSIKKRIPRSVTDPSLQKVDKNDPLDLQLALRYKESLSKFTNLIKQFTVLSLEYTDMLVKKMSLSSVHSRVIKLSLLHKKVALQYEQINRELVFRKFYLHEALYYMYQRECTNQYPQSDKNRLIYQRKIATVKMRSVAEGLKLGNDTLVYQSLVILMSSERHSFGKVVDFFGDTSLLRIKGGSRLVGLEMDDFIVQDQRKSHKNAC